MNPTWNTTGAHLNLQSNPQAAYLFKEEGPGYRGKRLFLAKIREEENSELLNTLRRRDYTTEKKHPEESKFLVFFRIDKELPLVGTCDAWKESGFRQNTHEPLPPAF